MSVADAQTSRPPTGRGALAPERSSPRRDLLHALIAALAWAGFVRLWWGIAVATDPADVVRAVALVVLLVVVIVPVDLAWVRHNVAIFRRKGPRTGLPAADLDYGEDWTGREVVADLPAVRAAELVVIDLAGGVKSMRPGLPAPVDTAARGDDRRVRPDRALL